MLVKQSEYPAIEVVVKNSGPFLLTGAAGFIGANLCRRLVMQGAEVHVFLRVDSNTWRIADILESVHVHHVDLKDKDSICSAVSRIKPRIIYHLATHGAYHYQTDVSQILMTNVMGLWWLLEACSEVGFDLFVNTGSSSEYGKKLFAMREDDSLQPDSFYAVAKAAQSMLCRHCSIQHNTPLVTFRPFSVYGPYEEPTRLIPHLLMACLDGNRLEMVSPHTARDFIHVDDVVDAYMMIDKLAQLRGEVLNICSGVQSNLKQLVDLAQQVSGTELNVRWDVMSSRAWDTDVWIGDISKARRLIGFLPQHSLRAGLAKSLAWYKDHANLYRGKLKKSC